MSLMRDIAWVLVVALIAIGIAVVATMFTSSLYAERSLLNVTVANPSAPGVPSPGSSGLAVRVIVLLILAIALIAAVFLVLRVFRVIT